VKTSLLKKIGRNKRLNLGAFLLALFAIAAVFADVIAPYDPSYQTRSEPLAPRTTFRHIDNYGAIALRPFFYREELQEALTYTYLQDQAAAVDLQFFVRGDRYKFLGLFESDLHLFGSSDPESRVRLLGTDSLGRDQFSRLMMAIRFSLVVSFLGTLLACVLGITVGIFSGYAGRNLDTVLMGTADAMLSLPTLILILAARAAFPLELPAVTAAMLLVVIFALTGWAEMARLTRGLVTAMREREFVLAAKATGVTPARILFRHILPNISRPLVTQATLIMAAFLLSEAALSFLGVGLQEPEASLGNMLAFASDVTVLKLRPLEILSPAIAIMLFVLATRLFSDGLKDKR
jgi:peptide/nickel transport system permease protein